MSRDTLSHILDLARWASSGDNTQPWRFEVVDDHLIRAHSSDTRDYIPPASLVDWIQLGIAVQRIWLTATHLGLHLQPQMTPVIFRWYAPAGRHFSAEPILFEQALKLSGDLERIANATPTDDLGFFARVGVSQVPQSRSIRQDLVALMKV